MPKTLEGYIGDEYGQPIEGIAATATRLLDGVPVAFGATQPDGRWAFTDLDEDQEHFVTLLDGAGRAAVRGPWSGELREAWVRDRLNVAGLPVVIDPTAGNTLAWGPDGLFVPPIPPGIDAYTKAESDARYAELTDVDPFPQYLTPAEASATYLTPAAADALFLTQAEGDARYPLKTDPDPYPTYLTAAEADALFLTQAEGDARYALIGAGGGITQADADLRYVNIDGDTMTGNLTLLSATPSIFLRENDAPANNQRVYINQPGGDGRLRIGATDDVGAAGTSYLELLRSGSNLTSLTLIGTMTIQAPQLGHRIGTLGPTGSNIAVPDTDASILLYRNSNVNWSGIGGDGSGNMWWRAGLSASARVVLGLVGNPGYVEVWTQTGRVQIGPASEVPLYFQNNNGSTNGTGMRIGGAADGAGGHNWIVYAQGSSNHFGVGVGSLIFRDETAGVQAYLTSAGSFVAPNNIVASGIVRGNSGVNAGVDSTGRVTGEIMATRAALPTHGLIYFGNAGSAYIIWPGSGDISFTHRVLTPGLHSNSDIYCYRSGAPTTGFLYLNNTATRYLGFDGTSYLLPSAPLYVKGRQAITTVNVNAKFISLHGWVGNGGVQTVEMGVGTHAYMGLVIGVGASAVWFMTHWPGVGTMTLKLTGGTGSVGVNAGYCNCAQSYLYLNMGDANTCNVNGVYYLGIFFGSSDAATY